MGRGWRREKERKGNVRMNEKKKVEEEEEEERRKIR